MSKKIPLTQGHFTTVDDDLFDWLNQWKWQFNHGYAMRTEHLGMLRSRKIIMHRLITGAAEGEEVDHIDRDKSNNQRSNLRISTHAENMRNRKINQNNSSGFKGVSWYKQSGKWCAKIKVNRVSKTIGYFNTPEDAALAYDKAAHEHHGEYASVNFPDSV